MKDKHLIDSCQAHLPVQYALNIKFIRQNWRDSVARANQASWFLHWQSALHWLFCFSFYTQQNR